MGSVIMVNADYDVDALLSELTTDEGKTGRVIIDTEGFYTIGIGHNLSANPLTNKQILEIALDDIDVATTHLDTHHYWWRSLPPAQARVMINMCFNLGGPGLDLWPHFLSYMQAHDFNAAANELKTTEPWFTQVGLRGPRMVTRLLTPVVQQDA